MRSRLHSTARALPPLCAGSHFRYVYARVALHLTPMVAGEHIPAGRENMHGLLAQKWDVCGPACIWQTRCCPRGGFRLQLACTCAEGFRVKWLCNALVPERLQPGVPFPLGRPTGFPTWFCFWWEMVTPTTTAGQPVGSEETAARKSSKSGPTHIVELCVGNTQLAVSWSKKMFKSACEHEQALQDIASATGCSGGEGPELATRRA